MSSKPFFSIVLPTRNRANLLPFAIQSVLNQTYKDFELIVSDNCSSDETPQVAPKFGDDRIKYYRSEKTLSMGDSWEFALSHAKGEFVTFLSDDDAYAKIFLETMFRVLTEQKADIVSCKITPFFANDLYQYGRSIKAPSLLVFPFNREVAALERKEAVSFLFNKFRLTSAENSNDFINIPQLVNTIYHSSIIKKAKSRVPNLFPVIAGDIYSAALFLNLVNRYCFVNEPLYLQTVWEGSATSSNQSVFEKYPEEGRFDYVPLKKLYSPPNYATNTILRAKADWGPDYQQVAIDWKRYFITSYQEIMYKKLSNIDVSEELEEFETVLSQQDENSQNEVRNAISKYNLKKQLFKIRLKDSVVGQLLLNLKYRNIRVFDHLKNITDYASLLNEDFMNKYGSK